MHFCKIRCVSLSANMLTFEWKKRICWFRKIFNFNFQCYTPSTTFRKMWKKSVKWPIKDWIWQKNNCIKVSQFVHSKLYVYEITKFFCQRRKKEKKYGTIIKKKFWTKKVQFSISQFPTIQINFNQVPPISLTTMFLFISILNLQLLPFFSRDNYSDKENTVRSPLHIVTQRESTRNGKKIVKMIYVVI